MSTPAPALILTCPACGKRYQGDPTKPNARYRCPADQVELVKPDETQELPPSQRSTQIAGDEAKTRVFKDAADKTLALQQSDQGIGGSSGAKRALTERRRSVVAMIEGNSAAAAPALAKDKYEVVGKLGQGGVGEVLKVVDRDLKREVAMKMLLPQSASQEDSLIRFVEEAQATGQLEHPNIVPVHDLGVDGEGRLYFTLKYVQGLSLKKAFQARVEGGEDGYSPLRMIEILISMCQALAYAHSKGIIHRDLKPDNVMLGKYGEVLVMDWGLAKVLGKEKQQGSGAGDSVRVMTSRSGDDSSQTMEGSIAGTPAYMAPEQAEGKISELDQRTDVYALGAILYEVLSGRPPYEGAGALQLVRQVVAGPPPPLKHGASGFHPIPRELKAICEKAMARRPEERYATASLLRDDLQAYLEHEPVSAAPDSALQSAAKWVRRNRRQVQTSAISVAAAVAIVFGAWFGYREWTIRGLLRDAGERLNTARASFQQLNAAPIVTDADPFAAQTAASAIGERNRVFRAGVNGAVEPLRRVLDIAPDNSRARLLLAEANMELWRRALEEENTELARSHRREVERYAPMPSPFADELNGFGSVKFALDSPDAEAFLFTFEMLRARGKDGNELPARLIPVPYDAVKMEPDHTFLEAERKREEAGAILPSMQQRHTIFNLDASSAARVGKGHVAIEKLPPGSYMLFVRAPGRIDVRVPFRMARSGKIDRRIELPRTEDAPPFFFYMAGGEVIVGGATAGAPAPRSIQIEPAFIFHDEISMGEYAEFLHALVHAGRNAEAQQRLPKDFGRSLATLNAAGNLVPADGSDWKPFAKSPVRGVSYSDAMAYVGWRSQRDGLAYRLPKDWEWEAACRGADARTYSWGGQPGKGLAVVTQGYGDMGNKMSWQWENYKDESPWGIHNLAGGAAEWTMSQYDPYAKPQDPVFGQLAIRGNAWALPPVGLECAFRTSGLPDYFHPTIGFRLALDYPVKRTGAAQIAPPAAHAH
jgi:serine/threonine protein kinase/formylglycine-generating enzyme required for sulfatase activity